MPKKKVKSQMAVIAEQKLRREQWCNSKLRKRADRKENDPIGHELHKT